MADATPGMAARDLRAVCEVTERRWASAIVKGAQPADSLPPLDAYLTAAAARLFSMSNAAQGRSALFADAGKRLAEART